MVNFPFLTGLCLLIKLHNICSFWLPSLPKIDFLSEVPQLGNPGGTALVNGTVWLGDFPTSF